MNENPTQHPIRDAPHFLIVGAQKAGTVSLHRYLAAHPGIVATKKEIAFFDQDVLFNRGYDWYRSHFPTNKELDGRLTFEATPAYLYYPRVPQRIHAYNPHMKLIVLLRNPAARAISGWNMYRNLRLHQPEFLRSLLPECDEAAADMFNTMLASATFPDAHQAMHDEVAGIRLGTAPLMPGYVQRGIYSEQLERYYQYFDRRQIHIVDSARLKENPRSALQDITRFLGLADHDWQDPELALLHLGQYDTAFPTPTYRMLRDFFRPHNKRLYDLLGRDFGWDEEPPS